MSTAKKLTKQKLIQSKVRRSNEQKFKKASSISRKHSSSLTSLQKRVDYSREQAEDIDQVLNQKMAQFESVQRLKKAATDRLELETQNKTQLESEESFASNEEEKESLKSRLNIIQGIIVEIKNEIKQRASMEKKYLKILLTIRNQKPELLPKLKKILNQNQNYRN